MESTVLYSSPHHRHWDWRVRRDMEESNALWKDTPFDIGCRKSKRWLKSAQAENKIGEKALLSHCRKGGKRRNLSYSLSSFKGKLFLLPLKLIVHGGSVLFSWGAYFFNLFATPHDFSRCFSLSRCLRNFCYKLYLTIIFY